MLEPRQTNTVYLSEWIKKVWSQTTELEKILHAHGVRVRYLKSTRDIWCRDYMPVQVRKDNNIQFRYEPSYHKAEDLPYRSNPKAVNKANNIFAEESDINLDGGNVVGYGYKAIVSDRIFDENPLMEPAQLIRELGDLLEAEILIMPSMKGEVTGHADGMIRFVDQDEVVIAQDPYEDPDWASAMKAFFKKHRLKYYSIPSFIDERPNAANNNAVGCYINFLEVSDVIVLPAFQHPLDSVVNDMVSALYPDHHVYQLDALQIADLGGVLNCMTWTVRWDDRCGWI